VFHPDEFAFRWYQATCCKGTPDCVCPRSYPAGAAPCNSPSPQSNATGFHDSHECSRPPERGTRSAGIRAAGYFRTAASWGRETCTQVHDLWPAHSQPWKDRSAARGRVTLGIPGGHRHRPRATETTWRAIVHLGSWLLEDGAPVRANASDQTSRCGEVLMQRSIANKPLLSRQDNIRRTRMRTRHQ